MSTMITNVLPLVMKFFNGAVSSAGSAPSAAEVAAASTPIDKTDVVRD